ncbi:MAG: MinD/ParA family protein [Spongiibacteraceae bacterium]|nr:MinD/ParA family protein [Spongiibacteraceae bacterium]
MAAKGQPAPTAEPVPSRVIAITSGKGGVGKSSIAVNLAISLAKTGSRVCMLDADTGLANVNILLGLTPEYSLEHVLFGAKAIEDVFIEAPYGVQVIPGANGIAECVDLHPRQQLRLTRELARIENDFDYLLVDTAAGISESTLDLVSAAEVVVLVITPEPTSLTDAFSMVKLLKRRRRVLQFEVVVNMCSSANEGREVYHRFAAAVDKYIGLPMHYLGFLLRDESMRAAVSLQRPVSLFPDTDPSARSFLRLADNLQLVLRDRPPGPAFSAYWQRRFRQRAEMPADAGTGAVASAPRRAQSDRTYLGELRARLQLLMEQRRIDAETAADTLQALFETYRQQYGGSPLDILALINELVQCEDRDDQLLRAIHDKVEAWGAKPPPALPSAPAEPPPASLPVASAAPPANRGAARAHGFDERRFGSQQALVALLREGDKPLSEVLAALG